MNDQPVFLGAKGVAILFGWYDREGAPNVNRAKQWLRRLGRRRAACVIRHPTTMKRMLVWDVFEGLFPAYCQQFTDESVRHASEC